MYYYYPTRQPVLVQETNLRVERRLPVQGQISVRVGERVEPSTIVAQGERDGRVVLLNVARELELEPEKVSERLVTEPGQTVTEGEAIARRRRGLRTVSVRSPFTGTFTRFDSSTGIATIRAAATQVTLAAHVGGLIEEVEKGWGVTIRLFGSRFYGAFGVGEETFGVLKLLEATRQQPLGANLIDGRCARAIVATAGAVSAAALTKAVQVGAKGVIAGSIEEAELLSFLKAQSATAWRVGLPGWQIPTVTSPLTVVVTEGFGRMMMTPLCYGILAAGEGQPVSLHGLTRLTSGLRRPEVLVPSSASGRNEESLPAVASLSTGTQVRLVDHDHLGLIATIAEEPRRRRIHGDLLVDALAVNLSTGERLLVPTANVEVLA